MLESFRRISFLLLLAAVIVLAIALFTMGLVCGATPIEAAEIANHASAVVVSKLGTATVTRDELIASFREETERE